MATGISDIRYVSSSHVRQVSHIYRHGNYNHNSNANDIAMVKLSSPVDLSGQSTRTACLPDSNESFDDLVCTVTGWGATHTGKWVAFVSSSSSSLSLSLSLSLLSLIHI